MMRQQELVPKESTSSSVRDVLLLATAVLILAAYGILRYGGKWGESDTASFTGYIQGTLTSGKLVPEGRAYDNGYGYPALAAFLIQVSGLSLPNLQLYGSALLIVWLVVPAWLLFREFTDSRLAATLATVILFVQPEFLFPILRGTHEKFTRGLMILCLYLLLRSLRSQDRIGRFVGFLLAFYLAGYALITFNNLISISFIMSIGIALALTWFTGRMNKKSVGTTTPPVQRLAIVLISLILVAFMFTFYAYPPAESQFRLLNSIGDRIMALFLYGESASINPYGVVIKGWVSLPVYWLVSLANWLLVGFSAVLWLGQGYRWWLRRQKSPVEQRAVLLWAFMGAFALIGALSVLIDVSGAIAGNLQLRAFPSFCMVAAPLVAGWLADKKPNSGWKAKFMRTGLAFLFSLLAIVSVIKATNEPLVSNKWIFYKPSEMAGLHWSNDKLPNSSIWTEFDERLVSAYTISNGAQGPAIGKGFYLADLSSPANLLISDVTRSRSLRLGIPLPITFDSFVIYDNGQTQIFHSRPKTPYQR
jgi:hypothetical protein